MSESTLIQDMKKDVERASHLVCPKCETIRNLMLPLPQRSQIEINRGLNAYPMRVENPGDPAYDWWLECPNCGDPAYSSDLPAWLAHEIIREVENDCRINRNYRN